MRGGGISDHCERISIFETAHIGRHMQSEELFRYEHNRLSKNKPNEPALNARSAREILTHSLPFSCPVTLHYVRRLYSYIHGGYLRGTGKNLHTSSNPSAAYEWRLVIPDPRTCKSSGAHQTGKWQGNFYTTFRTSSSDHWRSKTFRSGWEQA